MSSKPDTPVPVLLTSKGAVVSSAPDVMAIHTGRLPLPSEGMVSSPPAESMELATISAVAVVMDIDVNTDGLLGTLPADRVSKLDVSPVRGEKAALGSNLPN